MSSALAFGALALLALGGAVLVSRLRRQIQAQGDQIFALRSAEFVRSADDKTEEDEISRLRRLRQKLFSTGAETIDDRGEPYSLERINQRLGALGVV